MPCAIQWQVRDFIPEFLTDSRTRRSAAAEPSMQTLPEPTRLWLRILGFTLLLLSNSFGAISDHAIPTVQAQLGKPDGLEDTSGAIISGIEP